MQRAFAFAMMALAAACGAAHAQANRWTMRALLDGSPIGTHEFVVTGPADHRELQSRADFAVKLLGITAYRYHHVATERWQGDCLESLVASTDDDGKKTAVTLQRSGDTLALVGPQGSSTPAGCVMSFAYWNPAILKATRLLDPQSGKLEAVQVVDLGRGALELRGAKVEAHHWRIDGPARPIELWYSAEGEWLGLDSMVGRRHLSYRP